LYISAPSFSRRERKEELEAVMFFEKWQKQADIEN
jgi:hypothetical protein